MQNSCGRIDSLCKRQYTKLIDGLCGDSRVVKGVAEWLRAWETLTMFEATVCGRS